MEEPQKPFVCSLPDCGKSFTNEDHLHVHTKKHDMALQFGQEQKAAFVADQTPTPTRFIRNCEEVGLFQDLQNVNPFDEGFKRAMEIKSTSLLLEPAPSDDVLHTPQTVYPLIAHTEVTMCVSDHTNVGEMSTTDANNQVLTTNIKTNTTIELNKCADFDVAKNASLTKKTNDEMRPIMSQKSLEFVVDSFTSGITDTLKKTSKTLQKFTPIRPIKREIKTENDGYEVHIKLPNGKQMKMMPVDEVNKNKSLLKQALVNRTNKCLPKTKLQPVIAGTLIPVTLINEHGVPIPPHTLNEAAKIVQKKQCSKVNEGNAANNATETKRSKFDMESRSAASRRYRARLKAAQNLRSDAMSSLRAENKRLKADRAMLQQLLAQHLRVCPRGDDLRETQEKLLNGRLD